MTKYARDEFDRVPETSTRQGVHRAVAESRARHRLGPVLAAGAAALAVGLVAFLFLPKLGLSPAGELLASTAVPSASAAASPAMSSGSSESKASPELALSAAASAPTSPEPSTSAPASSVPASSAPAEDAPIDKTQAVGVFNATSTAGLATRVGATVSTAGWTIGTLGNWGGVPQQRSVIFYSGDAQKGNAEALSELLGIPNVVDSAEFALPLVVVLAPGFR